ncbi:MAG: class I SAM-dependent methyltransferase [Candidatus Paceibacterota bacterium]|jgi:SAM-dependent methyltransferase
MDPLTISTYNKLASDYDAETADFWENFPQDFLNEFVQKSGKKILNIGSGPGRDGLLLRQLGCDVVCLDASEAMIGMCKAQGFETVLGDLLKLPFKDGSFDGVWAYTSLLHIPKKDFGKAINQIVRVLVPGGVLGLGLIEGDTEGYKNSSGVDLPRLFSLYKKDEVVDILKEYGFELLQYLEFQPRSKKYLNFVFRKM